MLNIGIDENQGLLYEGPGAYGGRAVWPMPIITPAKIVFESEGSLQSEKSGDIPTAACRFREDFFDPISRIRRGRFYFASGQQPVEWHVQPHPALPYEGMRAETEGLRKYLLTFYGNPIWYKYFQGKDERPLVVLGLDDRISVWTVVDVEAISTGEDLVTLKARGLFGLLPSVDYDKVPATSRTLLRASLDALADEAHHSAPVSIVDRARDAASEILLGYFAASDRGARDLGELTKELDKLKKVIAASACRIIARLHARAKPVERAKRDLRRVREQDAELAIQCVGAVLCELGWAEWT